MSLLCWFCEPDSEADGWRGVYKDGPRVGVHVLWRDENRFRLEIHFGWLAEQHPIETARLEVHSFMGLCLSMAFGLSAVFLVAICWIITFFFSFSRLCVSFQPFSRAPSQSNNITTI